MPSKTKVRQKPDYILLITCLVLITLGILILASASAAVAPRKFGSTFYFLKHQLLFGLLPGIILGFWAFKKDLTWFKKNAFWLFFSNLILLLIVVFPKIIGTNNTTLRWLNLGPMSFQPAELLKLTLILYWASWWSSFKNKDIKSKNFSLLPFFTVISVIAVLLYLQPDISTLAVLIFLAVLIYFLSDAPFWHNIFIALLGAIGFFLLMKSGYRGNRLAVFLNPDVDPMGIGYQLKQSLITVGSGGISGVGLGFSTQKFGVFLPELISDSIFAIFAEETGFIGSFVLISLFLIFLWRGFRIAYYSKNKFNQLLAASIASWISLQAFINIGAMIGIVPLTGIPLPFISYGGSALISELAGIGILLNISKKIS